MGRERNENLRKLLKKVYNLISKGWTKREGARDKYGHPVDVFSKSAVKFCLIGAVHRACNGASIDGEVFDAVRNSLGHHNIINFNDSKSVKKEHVLRVVRAAIRDA